MNLDLEGRVCVVVGDTRGIAAATARMLSQEGARVLTAAREGADIELDVTVPDAGARVLEACPEPTWALVSSPGTLETAPGQGLSDADWQARFEQAVVGPMRV